MFSSAVFEDRSRNMSRSQQCHRMEIFCLVSSNRITFSKLFAKLRPMGVLKELFGDGPRSLKLPTQSLKYSYKHFPLFFPVFFISAPLAAQRPWALCPVCPWVNPALQILRTLDDRETHFRKGCLPEYAVTRKILQVIAKSYK